MNTQFNLRAAIVTCFIALTITYLLCIAGDLFFGWQMYQIWAPLLPGFTWPLTFGGFFLGLIWLVGYSLYAGLLFVLPYNFLIRRRVFP